MKYSFYGIAFFVIVFDQITKWLIREYLVAPLEFTSWFSLISTSNTGAGFGILQNMNLLLGSIVIIIIAGILYYRNEFFSSKLSMIAGGLILGGALGNLIDRLLFGKVTDFVAVGWWPVFNLADSAITVAVVLLIIDYFTINTLKDKAV